MAGTREDPRVRRLFSLSSLNRQQPLKERAVSLQCNAQILRRDTVSAIPLLPAGMLSKRIFAIAARKLFTPTRLTPSGHYTKPIPA
jgi:hypothetical protein